MDGHAKGVNMAWAAHSPKHALSKAVVVSDQVNLDVPPL